MKKDYFKNADEAMKTAKITWINDSCVMTGVVLGSEVVLLSIRPGSLKKRPYVTTFGHKMTYVISEGEDRLEAEQEVFKMLRKEICDYYKDMV